MTVNADTTSSSPAPRPVSIVDHFADLPDPRREQGRIHRLDEILFIATCAVLCGADNWVQIADYAHSKIDWLKTFLTLPGGIPSHDTFRRVFCLIDPLAFQECFSAWIAALMARTGLTPVAPPPSDLTPIAIDGKAQRGSARRTVGRSALHVVSAWAVEDRLTLGQVATDAKSNEITAIPELLALLDLKGAVVTIDAMGCQKAIAAEIIDGGATTCWRSRRTSRISTRISAGRSTRRWSTARPGWISPSARRRRTGAAAVRPGRAARSRTREGSGTRGCGPV